MSENEMGKTESNPFDTEEIRNLLDQLPAKTQLTQPQDLTKEQLQNILQHVGELISLQDLQAIIETFKEARELLMGAFAMDAEGPDTNTPLAQLLNQEAVASAFLTATTNPDYTDIQKARLMAALTIVSLRRYQIDL